MASQLYIGLMSGTSMDGIDGVVMDMDPGARFRVVAHQHQAFAPAVREALFQLNRSGEDEIHRGALCANALARASAQLVASLLAALGLEREAIRAVGAHGQTIRHRPGEFDATGYTCQLLNGALLAELCGIDVVCDFRSRDVAAGGQGAPLVPAFHRAAFSTPRQDLAVLNLGGIANVTFLHADTRTAGHDTGPGNMLMDAWCQLHTGSSFDEGGQWAAEGTESPALLELLLQQPYFKREPPKSTGRDLFNMPWLQQILDEHCVANQAPSARDVQATLCLFTARTVANDIRQHMPGTQRLLICGGGAFNSHLVRTIARELPSVQVEPVHHAFAMDPMQVEAAAFAWLASAFTDRTAANCIAVTGARGPRILGALYPA